MKIHERLSSNKTDYKSAIADNRAFVLTRIFRNILSTSLSDSNRIPQKDKIVKKFHKCDTQIHHLLTYACYDETTSSGKESTVCVNSPK